jgi:hypothetical protein
MLILVLSLLFIRIKFYLKANFPWKQLILLTVFILIYLTFLTFSQIAGATNGAETTNRTASPIYIHLILFILIGLEAFDFFMRSYWRNWIPTYIISVIYLIWLIFYTLGVLEKGITNCLKYGAGGVNSTDVRNSQLLKWIGENELEGTIYCNWPAALYFFYEIEAKRSPKRKTDLALYFQNEDKTTKKYLIWIKGGMPQMYYNFEEIYVQVALEEVATFSDGGVYIIK